MTNKIKNLKISNQEIISITLGLFCIILIIKILIDKINKSKLYNNQLELKNLNENQQDQNDNLNFKKESHKMINEENDHNLEEKLNLQNQEIKKLNDQIVEYEQKINNNKELLNNLKKEYEIQNEEQIIKLSNNDKLIEEQKTILLNNDKLIKEQSIKLLNEEKLIEEQIKQINEFKNKINKNQKKIDLYEELIKEYQCLLSEQKNTNIIQSKDSNLNFKSFKNNTNLTDPIETFNPSKYAYLSNYKFVHKRHLSSK